MLSILYSVTGLGFVIGVLAYARFCWQLGSDIKQGHIVVYEAPADKK